MIRTTLRIRVVCRFHFGITTKRLAVFDGSVTYQGAQKGIMHSIGGLSDICQHSEIIREAVKRHA